LIKKYHNRENKNKYGLLDSELNRIISIIQKNIKVQKLVLFGSRAKGNFGNGSDIDLALFGKDLNLDDVLNILVETDKLFLPYKFDIIIYERIQEKTLLEHIDRLGIILFDKED